jgi:hypothetical protein
VVLIFEARVERGQQGSEKHRLTAGLPSGYQKRLHSTHFRRYSCSCLNRGDQDSSTTHLLLD